MPTNILRKTGKSSSEAAGARAPAGVAREILIRAGRVAIMARLADTPTAARIWAALPLHSTAETWGESLHFEVPVPSGRERGARINGVAGEIYFWAEDARVLIVYGQTPISRRGEMRLPRPCNLLATTDDDITALRAVTPGEKVAVLRARQG